MSCCSPDRDDSPSASTTPNAADSPPDEGAVSGTGDAMDETSSEHPERASIPGGTFTMGTNGPVAYPEDGEAILHEVAVDPFQIDIHAVTNDRFAEFIDATGRITDAERYGWSFVFGGLLPDDFPETRGVAAAPWWRQVFGSDWRHPEGPHSNLAGRGDHPVIQVSHDDAMAFCRWDQSRLPTEAEWEFAARGGRDGAVFPWGDELEPAGQHRMNVWQGSFPDANSEADGHYGPAPVDVFKPNGYGLYNVCGNVWEWCADWFDPGYYSVSPSRNPTGPTEGPGRVMRGGSFLCHESYCHRYRVGARSSSGPDSSAGNLGFRTVAQ